MDDLLKTFSISSAGMKVQGARLRVISQNIANADSLPQDPNGKPYRRQTITFRNELDKSVGLETVRVSKVAQTCLILENVMSRVILHLMRMVMC